MIKRAVKKDENLWIRNFEERELKNICRVSGRSSIIGTPIPIRTFYYRSVLLSEQYNISHCVYSSYSVCIFDFYLYTLFEDFMKVLFIFWTIYILF